MKITAPTAGFTGTSYVGPYVLRFEDGVAEVDELNDGAKVYLQSQGYGIGRAKATEPEATEPETADPRDLERQTVGTPLRDAAVDPREGDFLAPTNAGEANPHGPDVVSPEIHASQGVRPVKGGDVHVDDTDTQDQAETAHTEAAQDGTVPGSESIEPPAGNASRDAWAEYARTQGAPESELAQDGTGLGRDELRDKYGKSEA